MSDNVIDEEIRCPGCLGRKQVLKLGSMLGDCTQCKATGKIKRSQLVVKPQAESVIMQSEGLPRAVPYDVHVKTVKISETVNIDPVVKVDPKRTIYRRKTATSKSKA